ncbi:MAG: molybdopterin dinucleotide binding domain-containing protein, partial [Actinomycetes bacterium]
YEIFAGLAEAMGCGDSYTEGRDADAWLDALIADSEIPDAAEFQRTGIYWGADQERVGLADFAADPERAPLRTPSGKVELSGAACVTAGLSEVPEARVLPADGALPLQLVTPKSRFRVHTQLAAIPWFRRRDDRTLWIHPADAARRGLADGELVNVTSGQGTVCCACRITDDILEGVVSLLAGVEPEFDASGCDVAGSANVLTSAEPTLPSRGARLHSTLVEVRRAGAV